MIAFLFQGQTVKVAGMEFFDWLSYMVFNSQRGVKEVVLVYQPEKIYKTIELL